MKRGLASIWPWLLSLALGVLVVAGICWLVKAQGWPWWAGVSLGLGVLGIVLLVWFVRKWLTRLDERKLIHQITEGEEDFGSGAGSNLREIDVLKERWKEAVDRLRHSQVKKHGQPLYVLPCYLMLGEPGSGKTTAIKGSRLHSALTDIGQAADGGGTQNCDWWFFDRAIILDTAGRYAIPENPGRDKREWQEFLLLLVKYRKREPINGVVVTIGADRLRSLDPDSLAEQGRAIRRRLDELMRAMGARFPVYVLVTKIDLVFGQIAFNESIPQGLWEQAMGQANNDLGSDAPDPLIEQAFGTLQERLKELGIVLAAEGQLADPSVLALKDELGQLKEPLIHFTRTLFEKSPYHEAPVFRGLYFGSARQEENPLPPALAAFRETRSLRSTTFHGYFLRDFFGKILPADRGLCTPIAEWVQWQRLTANVGLLGWLMLCLFLCGLLSLSFYKNQQTLSTFTNQFTTWPTPTADIQQNLGVLRTILGKIREVEKANSRWYLPRMGLTESVHMEDTVKQAYCRWFRQGILGPLDKELIAKLSGSDVIGNIELLAALVEHMASRSALLEEILDGKGIPKEEKIPQAIFTSLGAADNLIPAITASQMVPVYHAYLEWNQDQGSLRKERVQLGGNLKLALSKGAQLNWLVKWANLQKLPAVNLTDFWGRVTKGIDGVQVQPAFTLEGRKKIDTFLSQGEAAIGDPEVLRERKASFYDWYNRETAKAWLELVRRSAPAAVSHENQAEAREMAKKMAGQENPYFALLERMSAELAPLADDKNAPDWIGPVTSFPTLKAWALKDSVKEPKDISGLKAAAKALSSVKSVDLKGSAREAQRLSKAGEAFREYAKKLSELEQITNSPEAALQVLGELYMDRQQSPMAAAHQTLIRLNGLYPELAPDNPYRRLLSGPFEFLFDYGLREASRELQERWESGVLAEIRDVPEAKLRPLLLDHPSGLIWKFAEGPAAPFLGKNRSGYFPKIAIAQRFPFEASLLDFFNRGSSQTQMMLSEYEVTLKALPIQVNSESYLRPQSTQLTLDCGSSQQKLEDFNYGAQKDFKWVPDSCSTVTLKISFPDNVTLVKEYPGTQAFPGFVAQFKTGPKGFTQEDFPAQQGYLKGNHVTWIKVNYKVVKGGEPLRQIRASAPLSIPKRIIQAHIRQVNG